MKYLFKILTWVDKVKDVIEHQYVTTNWVNIKTEDNKPKYIYIYKSKKNKIPVTVSVCRCPVAFTSKVQLQVWNSTSNKIYF